jgi:hypothetical protein
MNNPDDKTSGTTGDCTQVCDTETIVEPEIQAAQLPDLDPTPAQETTKPVDDESEEESEDDHTDATSDYTTSESDSESSSSSSSDDPSSEEQTHASPPVVISAPIPFDMVEVGFKTPEPRKVILSDNPPPIIRRTIPYDLSEDADHILGPMDDGLAALNGLPATLDGRTPKRSRVVEIPLTLTVRFISRKRPKPQ